MTAPPAVTPGGAVAARPAASVLLLRDTASGLEVFVLGRVASMSFAPGMTVFPGGSVDAGDHEPVGAWAGPDESWWRDRLGSEAARSLLVAAVRELFEETGVLLAGPCDEPAPMQMPGEAERLDLVAHRISLQALLAGRGWALRSDLLRPVANWITPVGGPRRYDTFFLAARLPAGQDARSVSTEAEEGCWAAPAQVLEEFRAGRRTLMPPTLALLSDLARFPTVQTALDAARSVQPILPTVVSGPGEPLRVDINGHVSTVGSPGDAAGPGAARG